MSAIFIRKRFNIRNIRKFLLYSLSHDSNLRVTNPCLNRIARHECLGSLAHNYKLSENSPLRERTEVPQSSNSPSKAVDDALLEIDYNVQRVGRVTRNQVEEILSMIIDMGGSPSSTQSLYLLRCCGLMRRESPKERVELTEKIWKKLQDLGCQYDISHYNALLKVYVDSNHQFSPSDFLTVLESNNIQPNKVTFLHLMQKYCNDGNLDGASEILEFMREKGLPINENVFNTLITGNTNANDFAGAKDIFDVMRSSNLKPGAQSYVALASGYAKKGDIAGVKSVLKDMQDGGIVPSVSNYLSILSSLSSDEHLTFVDEIVDLMGDSIHEYRQDVLNTVIDLLNKNVCESAFKLILVISQPGERISGYNTNIFIQQLMKTAQSSEQVKHYCDEIASRGLNDFSLINAAKAATDVQKFDLAFALFEEMLKKGIPVRNHYLWPIFSLQNSEKEILLTLKHMSELGIPADFTTYVDYVLPGINVTTPDEVIEKIQETGHPKIGIIDPLFQFYCYQGKSDLALHLTRNHSVTVLPGFSLEKFISSHSSMVHRNHQSSFQQVLSYIFKNIGKFSKDVDVVRGTFLADLISLSPQAFQSLVRNSEDFSASARCLDVCYDICMKKRNPQLMVHLRSLEAPRPKKTQNKPVSTEEEDRELNLLKKNGLKLDSYLQKLLTFHIKERNVERVQQLTSEMENAGVVCSALTYSQLMNFYKSQNNVEMGSKYLKKLRETYPEFVLDTAQVLDFALTLIKYSKFEEAINVIKAECQALRINGSKEFLVRTIKRLFEVAIETNNVDLVRNIQSSLRHHSKDLQVTKLFFEPLIKMHLFRNDLSGAIDEFKSICVHNRTTPCLNLLLKKCIIADDHVKLETVIDAASTCEGRIKILHELFLAFFESGRKTQARKVLENLDTKVDPDYLENVYLRLYNDNNASELLELISVVRGFDQIDHSKLFSYLFKLYDRRNDFKKALDIFKEIEKGDINILNAQTQKLLANLLKRNNIPVPSTLSGGNEKDEEEDTSNTNTGSSSVEELHSALKKGDALEAIMLLDGMKKGHIRTLPLSDMTQLIGLLVEKELVKSLSENVQVMSYLIENANDILYPLLTRYSEVGDIKSMKQLSSFLPDFVLMKISFNGFHCKAYINSGKHEELLTDMENHFNQKNKIFSAVSFLELLSLPDLQERAINFAKKYSEKKFETPIAVVWAHYIINGNFEAAEELEKQYPVYYDRVDSIILRTVKQKENIAIARMYVDKINKLNPRQRCKDRAYGALLDLLVLKEMYSEAADLVKEAKENNITLELHYKSTLITLKSALERENKPVPFSIPVEESIISA